MRVRSGWRRFLLCLPLVFFLPHIFSVSHKLVLDGSVSELHQTSLNKRQMKKFDHVVLGPAAGEGLHDSLQCQGMKALNKTHFSASDDTSNFGKNIAFVTVFTTYVTVFTTYNSFIDRSVNGKSSDFVTFGNISYSKLESSMAILDVFINFIQVILHE
ncbi:hypothetical protein U1Q18_037443, partial [Sarracenia purpurea var. burkii]